MQEISVLVAIFSGFVSFFAPCIVPLIPAYISYVTGVSLGKLNQENGIYKYRKEIILSSFWYVLGFSFLFVLMGTTSASLGLYLVRNKELLEVLGGVLIMIFSLSYLGFFNFPLFKFNLSSSWMGGVEKMGYFRGFVVGMIFAVAWTPCIGPVLGSILTLAATGQTAVSGAILLFFYSLGISIPFLLVSIVVLRNKKVLVWIQKYMKVITRVSGLFLFLLGFLLFNNSIGLLGDWLTYDALNKWIFVLVARLGYSI